MMFPRNSLNEIKNLSPVFSAYSCQIIVYQKVTQLKDDDTDGEERYLLIATPGVFLLKKKFFGVMSILMTFPYADIRKLEVKKNYVKIHSKQQILAFKSLQQINYASRIHGIRLALFGYGRSKDMIYELDLDQGVSIDFERQNFTYEPTSKIVDIFLSNIIRLNIKDQREDLKNICSWLNSEIHETLEITPSLISKPYLSAIAATLATDDELTEIRIKDIPFNNAQLFLISILQKNSSISRIIFSNVSFEGTFESFIEFMKSEHCHLNKGNFHGSEWVFDNCDFNSGNFNNFLEAFIKYQQPVKILTFNRCNFSLNSFKSFSQTFLISKCFHSLEALWITGINFYVEMKEFLFQLLGSDWLLKDKRLHTLAIIDCNINIEELLNHMKLFETGIVTANLSKNLFSQAPDLSICNALSPQMNLVLENCSFCDTCLPSLFQALSNHKGQFLRLNCSEIMTSKEGWDHFSRIQSSIILPTLTELVWDRNLITPSNVGNFISFLKNQKNLTELSISDCIQADVLDNVIHDFAHFIRTSNLTSFTIQSTKPETSLGPQLFEILSQLIERRTLRVLDISGQSIGGVNMYKLVNMMYQYGNMTNFYFDHVSMTSAEYFIEIMNTLLKLNLNEMTWPKIDINKLLNKEPANKRSEIYTRIEMVKKQYLKNYKNTGSNDPADAMLTTIMRYQTIVPEQKKIHTIRKISSIGLADDATIPGVFDVYSQETQELLKECGISENNDPMKAMIIKFEKECNIETLVQKVEINE
ncbi:hypothetical protein TRFO_12089 [Tritrichomonas foetus]|uniref:Leucine Rich Repeat family protein n=1 Tax=Tritrichomonas foetus TaxID=1144522 RepID=A0A1J4J085_9EUKA|nr:hypothetical protein TRFO_12089 [Tritrichomonas foetus]|eukprot:OHS93070.1 hypothetical protein TRFO_12089 [Tritrichomonas foetus]